MQVNGISGGNGLTAAGAAPQGQDAVSRSIKQQIAELQKQMQQLSSNDTMSAEEKMKKRQELQKQISELNMELRQHNIEQQRVERQNNERKQEETSEVEELAGGRKASQQGGISQAGMQSIISADASMKQAKVQGRVAKQAEGRANVLKAEIKQDGPGKSAEAKEKQAAKLEQTAAAAQTAQADTLGKANRALKETAKEETEKTAKTDDRKTEEEKDKKNQEEDGTRTEEARQTYEHVDVRL